MLKNDVLRSAEKGRAEKGGASSQEKPMNRQGSKADEADNQEARASSGKKNPESTMGEDMFL